jgi:hypothetical protein
MTKNLPWILGVIGAVVFFAVFEGIAFINPDRFNTLSFAVSSLGVHWPISIFFAGFFCGGLASHFYWPWKSSPMGDGEG